MRSLIPGAVFLCAFFISGCNMTAMFDNSVRGSGVEKKEERSVGTFTAIDVSGAYDVYVTCGKTAGIVVSGDDNIVPMIKTEVKDGTLYIYNEGSINHSKQLSVTITTQDLRSISSSGASDLVITDISNDAFAVEVSGAGSVEARGRTGALTIDLSGATDVVTRELQAKKVEIEVSGASNSEVFASEELSADVSGVGNITYHGNPLVINQNVSGVGSISKK